MTDIEKSAGDDVLRWVSENGSGTWTSLNEAAGHAMAARGALHLRPWQLAGDMSALGHLDIDWDDGRWSSSPPCLVLARDMGLCAYLAGWRTTQLLGQFDRAGYTTDVYPFVVKQGLAPTAVFAKCGSVESAEELAMVLNIPIAYDAASQLVDLVSMPEDKRVLASPPPKDESLHIFEPSSLRWTHVAGRNSPGLYRFELHGRKVFRLLSDDWYVVDRSMGQLEMLEGRTDLLRWHPPSGDSMTPSVLRVHQGLSLPGLGERSVVSASGLLPVLINGWRIYRNVSSSVADRLGAALRLQTFFESHPISKWRA